MDGPKKSKEGRAARLAEALRDNLRRRKAQSRARRDAAGQAPGGSGGGAEEAEPTRGGRGRGRDAADVPRN